MILLRLIPTATHTLEDVQITLDAFERSDQDLKTEPINAFCCSNGCHG